MNIYFLRNGSEAITGGHKYNKEFIDYISSFVDAEVKILNDNSVILNSWGKIFLPIYNLRWIRNVKKNSLFLYADTRFKRDILFALCTRFFRKCKSVVIVHHFQTYRSYSLFDILDEILMKIYLYCMDAVIVPSPYTYEVAKSLFEKKKIFYIPIPFSKIFTPSKDYQIGNFLYVGTIERRKGLSYLVEALAIVRNEKPFFSFCLNIVGKIIDEKYFFEIKNRIKELKLDKNIIFLGRISNEDLEQCYKKAEIFLFPSLLEGYGIVLIEAMKYGLPVIAFNNTAMPYTIKNNINGLLADNKDSHSFAKKIIKLVGNYDLRMQLQEGINRTIVSLKDRSDFEEAIRNFYNSLLLDLNKSSTD